MKTSQRLKLGAGAGLVTMLLGALMVLAPGADAADVVAPVFPAGTVDLPAGGGPVPICHATNAENNPYIRIAPNVSAVGDLLLSNHAAHTGPVFAPGMKAAKVQWGDIIPPIAVDGHLIFAGSANWLALGAADQYAQCIGVAGPADPGLGSITVDKTNDANGALPYSDSEQAAAAGAPVPFQVVISNTGATVLTLETLTDNWVGLGAPIDVLLLGDLSCMRGGVPQVLVAGVLLPAGSVTTCSFSLPGYAPAAGGSKTNTVTVSTAEGVNDDDTSTVTTPNPQIIVTPPPPLTYTLRVDKRNDADGDGRFRDGESANLEGDDVTFQVTIRNTGTGALTLSSLTDVFDGGSVDLLSSAVLQCNDGAFTLTVGSVLAPGSVTRCTFELQNYAPAGGEDRTNTVTVATDRTTVTDDSTVSTPKVLTEEEVRPPVVAPPVVAPPVVAPPVVAPPVVAPPVVAPPVVAAAPPPPTPQVLGVQTTRTLARTGEESGSLAGVGAFMLALGAAMVLGSKRRFARTDLSTRR